MVWIGGMGILVLVVAILPLLGVGGAQAFKAETTGPLKETKLTPRIADTAKALYAIYFVLSLACFLAYAWAGMSWSDAFMHMCSTLGLGGFSSHDASFAYWNSPLIEGVAVVFMMLAGFSFLLHFTAWRRKSLSAVLEQRRGARLHVHVGRGGAGRCGRFCFFRTFTPTGQARFVTHCSMSCRWRRRPATRTPITTCGRCSRRF